MQLRPALLLASLAAAAAAPAAPGAPVRTLTVFAAASLTAPFTALKAGFEHAQPGTALRFSFAASSLLRTQIEQGAPADVFASADEQQMAPLVKSKLVFAPQVIARNRLALVVPAANPAKIASPLDLVRPGVRLVATSPAVPIGAYTETLLQRLGKSRGYPADFATKVAANVVSRDANVRAVLVRVELGEADAAFVYESDARSSRRVRSIPLPAALNVEAEYPAAVLRRSRERPAAEAFLRFLLGPEGRRALKRAGFH